MKKLNLIYFTLISLMLASCARTHETYPMNYLDTGKFETNFYSEQNGVKKEQVSSVIDLNLVTSFSRHWDASFLPTQKIEGIRDEDQKVNDQYLQWNEDEDVTKGYGPNKRLSNRNEAFKNGILSRLYDGRVRCDGRTYARTRIQINENGYSTYFPVSMTNGKYMAIALRGSTNLESQKSECNLATVDLKISLYQKLQDSTFRELRFVLKDASIETNTHGKTELLSFYFDEAFKECDIENYPDYLSNVSAMSIGYTLKSASNLKEGEQFALMLYEFLLPESNWM